MGNGVAHFPFSITPEGGYMLLDLTPQNLVITIINLIVLYVLLRVLFFKPVNNFLEQRREKVHADLDNARRDREEAQRLLKEHRQLVADNKAEAAKIIDQAVRQAEGRKDEIIAEASQEAQALLQRAKTEIAQERAKVLQELRADISGLSVAIVEKTLARTLTPQDQQAFFDAVLKEMDSYAN
jgi:F-type H+-transporting ATPase subunit b